MYFCKKASLASWISFTLKISSTIRAPVVRKLRDAFSKVALLKAPAALSASDGAIRVTMVIPCAKKLAFEMQRPIAASLSRAN
jgi:hypothetical protein